MEEALLSDTDRPYERPDTGDMGTSPKEGAAEQGAETPEASGGMEAGAGGRIHR